MEPRKKPGPHPEKPLEHILKTRVDNETLQEIAYCKKMLNCNQSEVLRKGVHSLYRELAKK